MPKLLPRANCASCGTSLPEREIISTEILGKPTRLCPKCAKSYKGKSWFKLIEKK